MTAAGPHGISPNLPPAVRRVVRKIAGHPAWQAHQCGPVLAPPDRRAGSCGCGLLVAVAEVALDTAWSALVDGPDDDEPSTGELQALARPLTPEDFRIDTGAHLYLQCPRRVAGGDCVWELDWWEDERPGSPRIGELTRLAQQHIEEAHSGGPAG